MSSATTSAEPVQEPVQQFESIQTKYLLHLCETTIDECLQTIDKSKLGEMYGQVVTLKPKAIDKLYDTLKSVIKKDFVESIQTFIVDEDLDNKFKILGKLSEEATEKQRKPEKAWRPTGLIVEQQCAAHDHAQKEEFRDELLKLVHEEEQKMQQLKEHLTTYTRPLAKQLESKCEALEASALQKYTSSQKIIEDVLKLQSEE